MSEFWGRKGRNCAGVVPHQKKSANFFPPVPRKLAYWVSYHQQGEHRKQLFSTTSRKMGSLFLFCQYLAEISYLYLCFRSRCLSTEPVHNALYPDPPLLPCVLGQQLLCSFHCPLVYKALFETWLAALLSWQAKGSSIPGCSPQSGAGFNDEHWILPTVLSGWAGAGGPKYKRVVSGCSGAAPLCEIISILCYICCVMAKFTKPQQLWTTKHPPTLLVAEALVVW